MQDRRYYIVQYIFNVHLCVDGDGLLSISTTRIIVSVVTICSLFFSFAAYSGERTNSLLGTPIVSRTTTTFFVQFALFITDFMLPMQSQICLFNEIHRADDEYKTDNRIAKIRFLFYSQ